MYKILKDHGFDDNHISMWAYNDIVNNPLNPYKGQIFHTLNNTNIYPGEDKIDFKGEDLTGPKFVRYLKELNTTENDDLYIYYNDHGAPNVLSTPAGTPMSTYQIGNTILLLKKMKKFKRLFFIVEACFSGCLKDTVYPENIAIITASKCSESSYSAIGSKWFNGNYMSNEFSSYVFLEMEENPDHTVQSLFEAVKAQMHLSTPTILGDMRDMKISEIIGKGSKPAFKKRLLREIKEDEAIVQAVIRAPREIREEYNKFELHQKHLTTKLAKAIKTIVNKVAGSNSNYFMNQIEEGDVQKCYEPVLDIFFAKFGEFNPDDGALFMPLKALCGKFDSKTIIDAIDTTL